MLHSTLPFVALALPLLLPGAPAGSAQEAPPPGMVLIEGGNTKVGTEFKDLTKMLEDNPQLVANAGGFLAEVPQHTVKVDDCYVMVTEVTNEQYRAYVEATKSRPPFLWGKDAIDVARNEFLQADAERRRKAKEEGRDPGERQVFDEAEWWTRNWKDAEWEMPKDLATKPVVYVDYQDARGYAEWAGLRLMTEEEYERACRGNTERLYPWGDEFKAGAQAATNEIAGVSDVYVVGSFAEGADPEGVMDLAGNVWEWTSSKYEAYPGWRHKKFSIGKGDRKKEIDTPPAWSPDRRVVRGGSMQNSRFYARCTTRGGFDRFQQASALGFRCAATAKQGFDFAVAKENAIPNHIRPQSDDGPVEYDPNQVIALDRWMTSETNCKVPGYAVIQSYDYILFTPTKELPITGMADITKGSRNDEVFHLGFLATSRDIVEPALPAGTYLVALRGAGAAGKGKAAEQPAGQEGEEPGQEGGDAGAKDDSGLHLRDLVPLDEHVENFIFFDMTGAPVAAVPLSGSEYVNPMASSLAIVERELVIPAEKKGDDPTIVKQKWLDLTLFGKGKSRKGVKTTLSLRFADGLLEGDWR
ncbi:MAG: SUMF1/EgtB/PvdO family nonheme iron enzyme [Planctomycetes bacterium]|nr:SUMF1/EgtB/PvdO family nonheme iron enzyme [Planctomycetota bacterium]